MAVSYDYYRIFYYVCRNRSFTKAAKQLMNSQPNVTRAMNNLEAQLGCRLFIRSKKGVELTPEGQKLFGYVSAAFAQLAMGERSIAAMRTLEEGDLFVAATETAMHRVLLPALKEYRSRYPGVRIRVGNYSTPEALESVRREQAELAVVSMPEGTVPGLELVRLAAYNDIPVAGRFYSELAKGTHSLKELADHPWISLRRDSQTYSFYERFFIENGLMYEPELQAATMDQILPMVESDLGLAFLPQFMAGNAVEKGSAVAIRLKETPPERYICIAFRQKDTLSNAARELMKVLKTCAEVI